MLSSLYGIPQDWKGENISEYNGGMTPSFYTRTGDDGSTGLLGDARVPKHHPRMEGIGALDEASAALGLAKSLVRSEKVREILLQTQRDMYGVMAEVAATPENAAKFRSINAARLAWLEAQTDELSALVDMPKGFILPGETPSGGALALARTTVRRAERRIASLLDAGEIDNAELLRYLNRLSSLCFVLELYETQHAGAKNLSAKKE